MRRSRPLLTVAIERQEWEAVALCLFLGVTRAARKLPPHTLEEMIALLADAPHRVKARKRGSR